MYVHVFSHYFVIVVSSLVTGLPDCPMLSRHLQEFKHVAKIQHYPLLHQFQPNVSRFHYTSRSPWQGRLSSLQNNLPFWYELQTNMTKESLFLCKRLFLTWPVKTSQITHINIFASTINTQINIIQLQTTSTGTRTTLAMLSHAEFNLFLLFSPKLCTKVGYQTSYCSC